jgi:hypothetical protein
MSDIYLSLTETPSVVTLSQPVIGSSVAATVTVGNTVTVALDANSLAALESVTVTVGNVTIGSSISISNFPATQAVSLASLPASTVTISNLPAIQAIAGTVTANLDPNSSVISSQIESGIGSYAADLANDPFPISGTVTVGASSVTFNSFVAKNSSGQWANLTTEIGSGYVNARVYSADNIPFTATVTVGNTVTIAGTVTASPTGTQTIAGTVTVGNSITVSNIPSSMNVSGTVTANVNYPFGLPFYIQGTVNLPKPTWTNYSGSITTAGTAVTAISNTSRSYLLAQVTTGQMFLNIGATATTLNSVYFSAGQGFAWETSVPQGLVSIISAVTGTNYVLKEG